jgi:heterodisulfide reductase subunit A2
MPEELRIGVYVCHCGSNIAGMVDVVDVAAWAGQHLKSRGVVVAREYKFMCSSLGQEMIEKDIKDNKLNRVVVAACSPHLHEATFRNAAKKAGLNPYLCELVSIREQDSWVHTDRAAATEKAKAIISGGVERVRFHEPLEPLRVPINPSTLVVGGGIAGIQAALEIADAGYHVYMVEREPSIGGHMAQFDKTFPTLDCSACILTPKMVSVGNHPNITLKTFAEVTKVEGYVGNFTVTVRQKARSVNTELCTGCRICVEKCPRRVLDEVFEAGIGFRKAIYTPFAQAVPKYPVLDRSTCIYFERGTCKACEKFCPTGAIDFKQEDEDITIQVGNIILATGFDLFNPRRIPELGYGRLANVFTSLEFERLSNAAGPTNGHIVLRDGVTEPETVAIVHCVGSRHKSFNHYCSAICCMQSLKFAHLVKEHCPQATIYEFYIDMRTPAKGYDEFYQRLLDEGTIFVRGRVAEVTDAARMPGEEGKLIVQVEDTLVGKQRRIPADMVILSCGLEPRAGAKEVAKVFGISCSADGWYIEKHPKLDPVATMTEGIFIAGVVQGPKDIPASVAQGAAAAARVTGRIMQKEMAIEPIRATVNAEKCSGCRICNDMCPYNAITFDAVRAVSEVNPALCQGCGTCVSACPAGAISGTGFSNEQILAQLNGLLMRNVIAELVPA